MPLRFRSGSVQLVRLYVEEATVIEAGDLLWLKRDAYGVGCVKPADTFTLSVDAFIGRNRRDSLLNEFQRLFVGIAHSDSAEGDTTPVSVDIGPNAVYEFSVEPHKDSRRGFQFGDPLRPCVIGDAGPTITTTQLEIVEDGDHAIARVMESKVFKSSTANVSFASAFHCGSANRCASLSCSR